jgi:uncharacterized paraquat-inducible protein A
MSISEHDLNCHCGQPVDLAATSTAVHCPRCGRKLDRWVPAPARPAYDAVATALVLEHAA